MGRGVAPVAIGVAALTLALGLRDAGRAAEEAIQRISVSTSGTQAHGNSISPAVSADGRFVAFASDAPDLVPGDTNGRDVFVRDRLLATTELASVSSDGAQANRAALFPAISGDGRYVVFQSDADNLVADDTNAASDIFAHDRVTGTTTRVSVASDGTQATGDSETPSISADGRYVTFTSLASDLIEEDTNEDRDVFVHDRDTGATELVSVASDGTQGDVASGGLGAGPARVSSDGRYVVFGSFASNLVPDDAETYDDVFVRDRLLGMTECASLSSAGGVGNGHSMYPSISGDGRYVVFYSEADNLAPEDANEVSDVFLRDRQTSTTVRVSDVPGGGGQANGPSRLPAISGDGGVLAFQSDAANLVPLDDNGATDIFLYDIGTAGLQRISVTGGGDGANGDSSFASISADGGVVAFQSNATNLVAGDTNGATDALAWGKPLAAPTATPTPTLSPTPTQPSPALLGDVDCGGSVNSIDAALILQLGAGLTGGLQCQENGDVNEDGSINAIDAALVLQYDAGLIDGLPP